MYHTIHDLNLLYHYRTLSYTIWVWVRRTRRWDENVIFWSMHLFLYVSTSIFELYTFCSVKRGLMWLFSMYEGNFSRHSTRTEYIYDFVQLAPLLFLFIITYHDHTSRHLKNSTYASYKAFVQRKSLTQLAS